MTRRRAEQIAWIAGLIGIVGAVTGWIIIPSAFPHAWLAALTVWIGWPVGCIGLLLIHSLTGGRWGYALRPQLIAGMITLPLILPAAIPVLVQLSALYSWMHPDVAAHLDNRFYLNLPFFIGRGVLYAIVWLGLCALILRTLRRPDGDAALARIAPLGLILLSITVTYSAIDSTMSLDPEFASSTFGLIEGARMGLFALSVSLLAAALGAPPDDGTMRSLSQLLLGLLILWAYLDFMQLLIVWESDLAKEAPWYVVRWSGGWGFVAGAIAAGHFLLPFFALIWPQVQRSKRAIACICALLVVSDIAQGWWLVLPAAHRGFGPLDVLAMLGLLGVAAALALRSPRLSMLPEPVRRYA